MRKRRHGSMKQSPLCVKWKRNGNDINPKEVLTCYQTRRSSAGISPIIMSASRRMLTSSGSSGIVYASNQSVTTRKTGDFLRSLLYFDSTSFGVAPLLYLTLKSCATLSHPYVVASFMTTRYILCSRVHLPPCAILKWGQGTGRHQGDKWGFLGRRRQQVVFGMCEDETEKEKKKEKERIVISFTNIYTFVWLGARRFCARKFVQRQMFTIWSTPSAYIERRRSSEFINLWHPYVV